MSDRKDYYKILGITEEEKKLQGNEFEKVLKSKYKPLVLKFHPDKQQNKSEEEKKISEEKFKEIAEAYEVLSDPQKRSEYDNPMSGFQFSGFGGASFEDLFNAFNPFGSHMGFNNMNGYANQVVKGQSIRIALDLTLEDMYNGVKKTIKYKRNGKCPKCNGSGRVSSTREEMCTKCGGTGQLFTQRGGWQTITTCPHCNGKGKYLVNPCPSCNGSGLSVEQHQVEIDVPKGVFNGFKFSLNGEGCSPEGGNGVNGDLIVVIREIQHNKFIRDNFDLYVEIEVPVVDAILGCTYTVDTIDGKKLSTQIPQGVTDGTKIRFIGKGMPIYDRPNQYGNMYAIVKIKMPQKLNESEIKLLNDLKGNENFK